MRKLPKKHRHLQQTADKNNINYHTFMYRLKKGMTPEEAASKPKGKRTENPYLTLAEENGISRHTYYQRVYKQNWGKYEASTIPPHHKPDSDYVKTAENNGISARAYRRRIKDGWSQEMASTKPVKNEYLIIAENNGISRSAYYGRVKHGWSEEEASSIPVGEKRDGVETPKTKGRSPKFDEYNYYRNKAIENGVSAGLYVKRVFDDGVEFGEAWK